MGPSHFTFLVQRVAWSMNCLCQEKTFAVTFFRITWCLGLTCCILLILSRLSFGESRYSLKTCFIGKHVICHFAVQGHSLPHNHSCLPCSSCAQEHLLLKHTLKHLLCMHLLTCFIRLRLRLLSTCPSFSLSLSRSPFPSPSPFLLFLFFAYLS